jgi:hypothetical protein
MGRPFSREDVADLLARRPELKATVERQLGSPVESKKTSKYRSVAVVVDGIRFASKREADRYEKLKMLQQAGEVSGFAIQPSFVVGKGVIYRADFFVVYSDGSVVVEDTKGFETQVFKIKAKLFKAAFPKLTLELL